MILLKSYPKSGSTWLRFILCNLLYPDVEHDFSTIKKYCPTFENKEENANWDKCKLMKTHDINITFGNTIYIHRHVGDVLISFWWHCKKFFDEKRPFEQFCEELNFGEGWRKFVNTSSLNYVRYENMSISRLMMVTSLEYSEEEWIKAKIKSDFRNIQEIEETKGIDCESNKKIYFCRNGNIFQHEQIEQNLLNKILEINKRELKLLGYEW